MKVLIADDDAILRMVLKSELTKLGHEAHEASCGREAWEAWQRDEFPLVISDWMMPDLDGLEFCRRIRGEPQGAATYIILLTGRSGRANYFEAMAAGVDDFVTKPLEKAGLVARLRVAERILGMHDDLCVAHTDLERCVRERTAELETVLLANEKLLAQASHELRTPMHHVLGFAQMLEMGALTAAQAMSVRGILTSGGHLLTMIDRLLAVAETSRADLSFIETDGAAEGYWR
jgi:DNA-binding response OmpR family regulator